MVAPPAYHKMSQAALIEIIQTQQTIIQRYQRVIPIENKKFAPVEKLAWLAAKTLIDQEKPNAQGLVRLPIDESANEIGMSDSTTGRALKKVCDRFDATYELVDYTTKKGQRRKLVYVNPTDALWSQYPDELELPSEKERAINGNNQPCPRCHTDNLQITTRRITYQEVQTCACCGYKKVTKVLDDKLPLLAPTVYWPAKIERGEPEPEKGLQADEPFENAADIVDAEKGLQADEPFETEDEEKGLTTATLPPSSQDCSLAPLSPSIPPVVPFNASPGESAACNLLLEIAGSRPEHIEMNRGAWPNFSGKYMTFDRAPHYGDILGHLRGVHTIGASLRHPFNSIRARCFEADNPQDWQRLKEDALLLAAAGFKPILEPSPARDGHIGGGHEWIIFDTVVDDYSSYQTLLAIAPQLGEVKEYWPHEQGVNCPPNVRLPGGKYVRPGYEAWCSLYDAYGNELSHDGAGAAAALLEMQTPAALVKKHEKPMELVITDGAITTKTEQASGGILGEGDVLPAVLAEFEHSWDDLAEMAGGYNKEGYFPAKWRGDKNPNVKEWKGHDLARDFSTEAWPDCRTMDRHHVWCLLQAGANWREFRRLDLDRRCQDYRARQLVTA